MKRCRHWACRWRNWSKSTRHDFWTWCRWFSSCDGCWCCSCSFATLLDRSVFVRKWNKVNQLRRVNFISIPQQIQIAASENELENWSLAVRKERREHFYGILWHYWCCCCCCVRFLWIFFMHRWWWRRRLKTCVHFHFRLSDFHSENFAGWKSFKWLASFIWC